MAERHDPHTPPPPLGAEELENLDLHMLREWLDESLSDGGESSDGGGGGGGYNDDDAALQALLLRPAAVGAASPAPSTASSSATDAPLLRRASSSSSAAGKRQRVDDEQGKRRTWPSQREELVFLRTEVCTLENELRELKAASRRQFSTASAPLARFSSAGDGAIVACNVPGSLWEQVANRQLDEKVRAEVENRKLRDMVDAQVRLAKRLQQLLRKRQVYDGLVEKKPKFDTDVKPEEPKIYSFLTQIIQDRYPQIDTFLEQQGLSTMTAEARDVNMKFEDGAVHVEMKECKLMPFDFVAANDAAWRCLKSEVMTMHNTSASCLYSQYTIQYSTQILDTDNTVLRAKVAIKISGRGAEVTLTVWSVWRRFVEANRAVYLVEALGITGGGANTTAAPVIQVKQSATGTIERFDGSSAPEASIIKVYLRSSPSIIQDASQRDPDAGLERHPQVGMLTEVLIGLYHQNIEMIYKAVENQLLNDMLSGKKRG